MKAKIIISTGTVVAAEILPGWTVCRASVKRKDRTFAMAAHGLDGDAEMVVEYAEALRLTASRIARTLSKPLPKGGGKVGFNEPTWDTSKDMLVSAVIFPNNPYQYVLFSRSVDGSVRGKTPQLYLTDLGSIMRLAHVYTKTANLMAKYGKERK